MTSTDTYQLKWHSHSSHLNGSVASLLRSERFTDVVLCTMDGSQIPAHKFILSSCSVYLSNLFEGQRSVTRMGGMLYVVLPSEISTKALKILVEYMYKGETTVSNEVLDTVLKAGEVLKIRGLWRQTDESGAETTSEKQQPATTSLNKAPSAKKPDTDVVQVQQKLAIKKDDKLLKTFGPLQPQGGTGRPMFIGPPKLVFIKTNEGGTQMALRPGAPKGQTILVAPAQQQETITIPSTPSPERESPVEIAAPKSPRVLRRQTERKYGKKTRTETNNEDDKSKDGESADEASKKSSKTNSDTTTEITVKEEPEWDASSIEEEERSIAEMFQAEMSVKAEPVDEMDIEEESLDGKDCEVIEEEDNLRLEGANKQQDSSDDDNTGELATLTPLDTEVIDTDVQAEDITDSNETETPRKHETENGDQKLILPIDSEEAFISFENHLTDADFRKSLLKKFSKLCCKRGRGTWTDNAYFLVDFMFTRRFMTFCSWTGVTKTETTKLCFKSFKNTVLFFFEVVYKSDKSFRFQTCENFFMNVLRHSKRRSEARHMKLSSAKIRVGKPQRFRDVDSDCLSTLDTSDDEVDTRQELAIISQSQTNDTSHEIESETIHASQKIQFDIKELPIDSVDTLTSLETSLTNPATKKILQKGFSMLCYKQGSGAGLYNAYVLVDYMFTRRFMTLCSWAGGSKQQIEKLCFRAFRRTIHFFYEIISKFDKRFTFRHCEAFFKNVLRNSNRRNKSKPCRRSVPKDRSRTGKGNTKEDIISEDEKIDEEETSDVDQEQTENKIGDAIITIEVKPEYHLTEQQETSTEDRDEVDKTQVSNLSTPPLKTETNFNLNDLPIESVDSLKVLEQKVTEPIFRRALRNKCIMLCHKQGRGSGLHNAYILVDHMFTRKFMAACSWNGGSKDGSAKTRFRTYRNIVEFFYEVVNKLDKSFTMRDCVKFFGNILKNALKRALSKQMRRSAPKKRRRTAIQKKDKTDNTMQEVPVQACDPGDNDIEPSVSESGPSQVDPMNVEDSIEVEMTQDIFSQLMPSTSQWEYFDVETTKIHDSLPVDSEDSLRALENQLNDTDFRNTLKNNLHTVCPTQGKGSALHNAYVLVDYMFTRKFLTLCSWAGGSRRDGPKICFKVFINTIQLFSDVLSTFDESHTLEKCKSFFGNVTRNAVRRLQCNKRRSAPKNRKSKKAAC